MPRVIATKVLKQLSKHHSVFVPISTMTVVIIVGLCGLILPKFSYAQTWAASRTWTEDPTITAGATPIKADHFNRVRNYIEGLRVNTACTIPLFTWDNDPLVAGAQPIRALHIEQRRNAIDAIYAAHGRTKSFVWTDSTITAGTTAIRKVHIDELRQAFNELTCCGDGECQDPGPENCGNCSVDCGSCGCPPENRGSAGFQCQVPALNISQSGGVCDEDGICSYTCTNGGLFQNFHNCNPWDNCGPDSDDNGSGICNVGIFSHGTTVGGTCDSPPNDCTAFCNNGVIIWTNNCAGPTDCLAQDFGSGASQCSVPALNNGDNGGSCAEEGSCSYTCNDGVLSENSNTCNPWEDCLAATNGPVGSQCSVVAIDHGNTSAGTCDGAGTCSATCTDGSLSWTNNCGPETCSAYWFVPADPGCGARRVPLTPVGGSWGPMGCIDLGGNPAGCTGTMSANCLAGSVWSDSENCAPVTVACSGQSYNTGSCGNVTLPGGTAASSSVTLGCPGGCGGSVTADCNAAGSWVNQSDDCAPPDCVGNSDCDDGDSCTTDTCVGGVCSNINNPVDGGWGPWGDWFPCTEPCGGGQQVRFASCDNPPPSCGGANCPNCNGGFCPDVTLEFQSCNTQDCPVDGEWCPWGEWSDWGPGCGFSSCGPPLGQERERHRTCDCPAPANDGAPCSGLSIETESQCCPTFMPCPACD